MSINRDEDIVFPDPINGHITKFDPSEHENFLIMMLNSLLVQFDINEDYDPAVRRNAVYNLYGFDTRSDSDKASVEWSKVAHGNAPDVRDNRNDPMLASAANYTSAPNEGMRKVYRAADGVYRHALEESSAAARDSFGRAAAEPVTIDVAPEAPAIDTSYDTRFAENNDAGLALPRPA